MHVTWPPVFTSVEPARREEAARFINYSEWSGFSLTAMLVAVKGNNQKGASPPAAYHAYYHFNIRRTAFRDLFSQKLKKKENKFSTFCATSQLFSYLWNRATVIQNP